MENEASLEKWVVQWQSAGKEWVEAKLVSDQLSDDEKAFLADLMNGLDDGKKSEAKLDRQARGSSEFREHITNTCIAKAVTGRKKVRFDAFGMLFEARRSELSFEREKLSKGIFHKGG